MFLKILHKGIIFLGFLTFINACTFSEDEHDDFDPAFYSYDMTHFASTYMGCSIKNDDCTYMSFDYPKFKNSANSEVLQIIDRKIEKLILNGTEAPNPESACETFIINYEEFVNDPEIDDYKTPWFDKRKATWLSIEKKVLSIEVRISNFMGGAHSNSYTMLRNFDPYTGDSLGLGMIFNPESLQELTKLGEMHFRKTQKIKSGIPYEEAGFWFKDDQFYLTDNFAFTDEGLLFYYNEYEIAPYSMGAQYFVIPYSLIMHLFE
jgi:hypothetical protein